MRLGPYVSTHVADIPIMFVEEHMDEEFKVWAAGFFDGEGSVLISFTRSRIYGLHVAMGSTDPTAVELFYGAWGGSVTHGIFANSRSRNSWNITFDRPAAKRLLVDLIPYLRLKQQDAIIVLRAILAQETFIRERCRKKGVGWVLKPFYEELRALVGSRDHLPLPDVPIVPYKGKLGRNKPPLSTPT